MSITKFSNISSIYNDNLDALVDYAIHLGFDEQIAMDAIHDLFYKLCIRKYVSDKSENIQFYLFRSLRNRLIDIYRTQKKHFEFNSNKGVEMINLPFQLEITIEDKIIMKEDRDEINKKIKKVLSTLTHRQREIIYLRYLYEYSYEEIAKIMQISIESSRNLMSRTLNRLKNNSLHNFILIQFLY